MGRHKHYRLLAYVCGHNCVVRIDDEAGSTYQQIFVKRPSNCRYAVVGQWNVIKHDLEVIVFDLYATMQKPGGTLITPEPVGWYSDYDQAVMATAMLYEGD